MRLIRTLIIVVLLFATFRIFLDFNSAKFYSALKNGEIIHSGSQLPNTPKIIIGTDNANGVRIVNSLIPTEQDDALAIALLLKAKREGVIDILGIDAHFGNTSAANAYRVTKEQVSLFDQSIPTALGSGNPNDTENDGVRLISKQLSGLNEGDH